MERTQLLSGKTSGRPYGRAAEVFNWRPTGQILPAKEFKMARRTVQEFTETMKRQLTSF